MCTCLCACLLAFFGVYVQRWHRGSRGDDLTLNLLGNRPGFLQRRLLSRPREHPRGPQSLRVLASGVSFLKSCRRPGGCERAFHCAFRLRFPREEDVGVFPRACCPLCVFLGEISTQVLCWAGPAASAPKPGDEGGDRDRGKETKAKRGGLWLVLALSATGSVLVYAGAWPCVQGRFSVSLNVALHFQ